MGGNLGYVSQQSWIFSGTVRDNICLGSTFEPDWFSQVVEVCGLTRDLELLQAGDLTEVGERGLTLSGGQKQRVSLARALYSRADILLLDDPLSAVDAKVGQFIFRRAIKECLRDKTVLLVSHGLQYLRECDSVIFLKDGRIVESGQPGQLLARPGGHLAGLAGFEQERDDSREQRGAGRAVADLRQEVEEEEEEVELERPDTEPVSSSASSWAPLFRYLAECGHPLELVVIFIFMVAFILANLSSKIFLQKWLDAGDGLEEERTQNNSLHNTTNSEQDLRGFINDNPQLGIYQLVYGLIILAMYLTGFIKVNGKVEENMSYRAIVGSLHIVEDAQWISEGS